MLVNAELHCHTTFSDGFASPERCIQQAARRGIQVLAISDHNTADGALPYWDRPLQDGVLVIPAEEISTDLGHILAFFVRQTILPGRFDRVLADIRTQGALPFMAHPYHIPLGNVWRRKPILKLTPAHLGALIGLEVENGHNRPRANALAVALAQNQNMPAISGSDAHLPWEIGNALTILNTGELTHPSVRVALSTGQVQNRPRRFNGYGVYLMIGLLNRLSGRSYAWKNTPLPHAEQ
jgi:predicted metal-dependent phosphoesterase TrpH